MAGSLFFSPRDDGCEDEYQGKPQRRAGQAVARGRGPMGKWGIEQGNKKKRDMACGEKVAKTAATVTLDGEFLEELTHVAEFLVAAVEHFADGQAIELIEIARQHRV